MTPSPHFDTLIIAGCGLLGGSLGMAARRRGLARRVIGAGRNEERLRLARQMGAIDEYTGDLAAACREAGLIVLCTPVATIEEQLATALRAAPAGAIVTDVGSTKAAIAAAARKIKTQQGTPASIAAPFYVGSHPMAGSDRSGIEFASPDLYDGATCFVTLDPATSVPAACDAAARVAGFWRAAGCRLVFSTPARHDALAAAISHLPHFAAVALAASISGIGETPELLRAIAGNGFRDTTRVAAGDPAIWRDIALTNAAPIAAQFAALRRALDALEAELTAGRAPALEQSLAEVQAWRRAFDSTPEPPA